MAYSRAITFRSEDPRRQRSVFGAKSTYNVGIVAHGTELVKLKRPRTPQLFMI